MRPIIKILGVIEKGCKWRLGAITNKIKISTSKISLFSNIGTPPNSPRKYILAIANSGVNTHIENEATPTMAPVIMSNAMTTRLPYGSTMESSHVVTFQLPGLTKKSSQIHIYPKIRTSPLISFGVLCDDRWTITIDQQDTTVQNNGQQILKFTRNKKTGIWEVTLITQQSKPVVNKIMDQTTRPELAQYLHNTIFIQTTTSLLNLI